MKRSRIKTLYKASKKYCCLLLLLSTNAIGQTAYDDRIQVKEGFIPVYTYQGQAYTKLKNLKAIILSTEDEQVKKYYRKYSTNRALSGISGGVGGVMIGFPIGGALAGEEFNTPVFVGGIAVISLGLLVERVSNRNAYKAIARYNELTSSDKKLSFVLLPSGQGVGIPAGERRWRVDYCPVVGLRIKL